jgi:hypothetical protein
LPLNFESATHVEIAKSGDLSFLGFNVAIASDSGQMAPDNQRDTPGEQNDQDFSHVKYVFSVMMR